MLFDWDGSALSVQHLKLDLVSKNMLQRLKQAATVTAATEQMEMS